MNRTLSLVLGVVLGFGTGGAANACSDVLLDPAVTGPQGVVSARTMDFNGIYSFGTEWVMVPRGMRWNSMDPSLHESLHWEGRYGFVGMDFLGRLADIIAARRFFFDGMNERGLSAAWLWLDDARFPTLADADYPQGLFYLDVVAWILGQYQTIDEVKTALTGAKVFGLGAEFMFPLHLVVHDASGHSLIAEWYREPLTQEVELHLYDGAIVDQVGVMTNSPVYLLQLENLAQYQGISNAQELAGVPGSFVPADRFVRLAKLRQFMLPIDQAPHQSPMGSVVQALHIMDNVDVVHGTDYDPNEHAWSQYDETGITLVRDHSRRRIYFKGMHNPSLRKIDLAAIDFQNAPRMGSALTDLPADLSPTDSARFTEAEDVTAQLAGPSYRYYAGTNGALLDLDLRVNVSSQDQGQSGRMFIWSQHTNGTTWNWRAKEGWTQVQGGNLLPCYVGRLSSRPFTGVLVGADAATLAGTRIFAGYGRSAAEMLLAADFAQVFMVEIDGRFQAEPEIE